MEDTPQIKVMAAKVVIDLCSLVPSMLHC